MNNNLKYNSDLEVRYATYQALGGTDPINMFDSVYSIDLEILRLTEEGGGGLKPEDFKTINGESIVGEGDIEIKGDVDYKGLTFTAEQAGSTVKYINSKVTNAEYSTDGTNWSDANGVTITLNNVGDKVYFRGQITGGQTYSSGYAKFTMTGLIAASGNINSLNNDSNVLRSHCYDGLFSGCGSLTKAPELPSTRLAEACYSNMFYNCGGLTKAPELPATTLANSCYNYMFSRTSLTKAPELPSTMLAGYCYCGMFSLCTKLTQAPELPATTLVDKCYNYMFDSCTSLTTAPELPVTTLVNGCYASMFRGCTSLTKAPELPATTLANLCYYYMFVGCTSLTEVTTYATSWNNSYTSYWLNNVPSTGTFYNLGGASIPTGVDGIPSGWTEKRVLDNTIADNIESDYTTYSSNKIETTFVKTSMLTQAEYDALEVKDPNTLYIITDAE